MVERKLHAVPGSGATPRKRAPRKAAPAKPKTVSQVIAAGGTHREILVAMRDRIAKSIDDPKASPTALAALIRRRMDVAREIAAIDAAAHKPAEAVGGSVVATTPDEPWDQSKI